MNDKGDLDGGNPVFPEIYALESPDLEGEFGVGVKCILVYDVWINWLVNTVHFLFF